MAEAHSAVAFQFLVTNRGVNVMVNRSALFAAIGNFVKKSLRRAKLYLLNLLYPFSPAVCVALASIAIGLHWMYGDWSGLVEWLVCLTCNEYIAAGVFGVLVVLLIARLNKWTLKLLLHYHGWMYEPVGKPSVITKVWFTITRLLVGRKPSLYSLQDALPALPLPSVKDTIKRYLCSVEPWMSAEQFDRVRTLAHDFQNGPANKLQLLVTLKWLFSSNYVSDWWESYVYLYGRSPIMVNSNWYGVDLVLRDPPTRRQAARAAMFVHCYAVMSRRLQEADQKPIMIQNTIPLCSWQYERTLNTVRQPGEEKDTLVHQDESDHVTVYCRGRMYVLQVSDGRRLYKAAELEEAIEFILEADAGAVSEAERRLPALTAGDRTTWARARTQHFSSGVNRASLEQIETSMLFLALDEAEYGYDESDESKMGEYAKALLHGDCHSRWFDMSFTAVVGTNARFGANAEHSYADGPAVRHVWEYVMLLEQQIGYTADGHCAGGVERRVPQPARLKWSIGSELSETIDSQLETARRLANDVDMNVSLFRKFGKGAAKRQSVSPDAFIQLALQLAYYRDQQKFCLTYESSMTRLFREGRTETVRSCTSETVGFVRAMEDGSKSREEKVSLFRKACENHQNLYRDAMTGKGIDRHLFTLYVASRYLGIESAFLKEVLSEPWRLSTSQVPYSQIDPKILKKHDPDSTLYGIGGGFGPVSDDGYGVSYMIIGEDKIAFHISSKFSCATTSSSRFAEQIRRALVDIDALGAPAS